MSIKIKICGVTLSAQAREIARLGADYIGCVIEFPRSPRSVSAERAREIREAVEENSRGKALPYLYDGRGVLQYARTQVVGVVVDLPFDRLRTLIEETGIHIWQLHGEEDEQYIRKLKEMGVEVWKVIRGDTPRPDMSLDTPLKRGFPSYGGVAERLRGGFEAGNADKVVVDAKNPIHGAGGSGALSDWKFARELQQQGYSVVLSGGLNQENVLEAIQEVQPDVVDVSSGVEARPGVKGLDLVKKFIKCTTRL